MKRTASKHQLAHYEGLLDGSMFFKTLYLVILPLTSGEENPNENETESNDEVYFGGK